MSKNVKTIVGIAIAVIIVAGALLYFFVFNNNNQADLKKELESVGRNFYENFYYDKAEDEGKSKAEFLAQFKEVGIKVDLENLMRASENKDEIKKKFVNSKTKEECNQTNTKVTIKPKDPYGKTDYTIEVTLDCGFNK